MITSFQIYERLNVGMPKVGDWVKISLESNLNIQGIDDKWIALLDTFFEGNLGQIIDIEMNANGPQVWYDYMIKFTNIPKGARFFFNEKGIRIFNVQNEEEIKKHIEYWSENKNDILSILKGKRFDL